MSTTGTAHRVTPQTAGSVVIRVNSHRAHRKLTVALDRKPQYWSTWKQGGVFVILTAQEATAVLPVTGITRSRVNRDDLGLCDS